MQHDALSPSESAILAAIACDKERWTAIADQIHGWAELGYQEHRSSALLATELEQLGFEVTRGVAGLATAFRAVLRGPQAGPRIALLAEYDALPGLGHACGHNLIGAAALAAAAGMRAVQAELPGELHVYGTPAEEGYQPGAGGKVVMFEEGAFEGIDAAFIVHAGEPFSAGGTSLARDNFRLTFRGRRPRTGQARWDAVDSQDVMLLTQVALNVLRQRVPPEVVIQWTIEQGGDNPNIIPVASSARLYVRAPRLELVSQVVQRIKECAAGAAQATGGAYEFVRHAKLYDEMVPNRTLNELFLAALVDAGAAPGQIAPEPPGPVTHSDDTGIISKHLPTISGRIVVGPPGLVLHTAEAAAATRSPAAHRGLLIGAKAMALSAWRLANSPELLSQAWSALSAAVGGA